jgi:pimeloyl-ACP methyl ester carboxylesterase
MAADAAALLEALDIEMADLVGYSLGGAVGLELAMQRLELIRRLVFAGGLPTDVTVSTRKCSRNQNRLQTI